MELMVFTKLRDIWPPPFLLILPNFYVEIFVFAFVFQSADEGFFRHFSTSVPFHFQVRVKVLSHLPGILLP